MPEISEIFGEGKLSYEEFLIKAGEMGAEIGDVGALRRTYEEELRGVRCHAALERELDRFGAKNRGLVSRVIDLDTVTVDEDGVHGLTEQLDALRQSDPYLFEAGNGTGAGGSGNGGGTGSGGLRGVRIGMPHGREMLDPNSLSDADFYKQIKQM